MKKLVFIGMAALVLAGCETTGGGHVDPGPPPKVQIVIKEVPVPVMCKVVVGKPTIGIEDAKPDMDLEDQNSVLRQTIAQQAVFITDLIAGLVGCGGSVK